jgi:hypothetical protein
MNVVDDFNDLAKNEEEKDPLLQAEIMNRL